MDPTDTPSRLTLPVADVATPASDPFPQVAHLSLRLKMFRQILKSLPEPKQRRLLDLGSGPGHFARLAVRHGYSVTALDARPPWALGSSHIPERRNYTFIQSDLRDFQAYAAFDVILCIGLLYHLPLAEQQWLLSRCHGRTMLIDTELFDRAMMPAVRAARFAPTVSTEGYEGALCAETGNVWSSHGNERSFWCTQESIMRLFADCGWGRVTVVDPAYCSAFGPRRWFWLEP